MTTQNASKSQSNVLEEIIDNAVGLPVDSLYLLLMMARAMHHTHNCLMRQIPAEQPRNPPEQNT